MAQVLDLRGRQLARDRTPVLLDPSGGRARVLAWTGRGVALVFLLWLIGLVFAGLGLLPSGSIPLGRALVGQSPPPIKGMPLVTQPGFAAPSATGSPGASSQSTAARAAGGTVASSHAAATHAAGFTAATSVRHNRPQTGLGSPARPGHGHAPVAGTVNAGSGATTAGTVAGTSAPVPASHPNNGVHAGSSAPGRTTSQSSPGHTKSSGAGPATGTGSSNGSSGNGHQTTTSTTTSPGKSGSSPAHASVR
jgi:hypothetical protein